MEIFDIFGAAFPPPAPIEVIFCTAKRTQVSVGPAKFDLNRCNESPLRGEKPDYWSVSKLIPAVCHFAAILPLKMALDPLTALTFELFRMSVAAS